MAREATRRRSEDWFLPILWRSGFTCNVVIDKREARSKVLLMDKEGEKKKEASPYLCPLSQSEA